jgi:serine/threonine protein kinase
MPATAGTSRRTTTAYDSTSKLVEDDEARPYVIVSLLGKGSFATVYKGYHEVRRAMNIPLLVLNISRKRDIKLPSRPSNVETSAQSFLITFKVKSKS